MKINNKLIEKNIITAGINSNYTVPADGARVVTLDKIYCQTGNTSKLNLINGNIVIGSGVKHVMISASVAATGSGSVRNLYVNKNNDNLIYISNNPAFNNSQTCMTAQLFEVSEGDMISLGINFTRSLVLQASTVTNLTVEVID